MNCFIKIIFQPAIYLLVVLSSFSALAQPTNESDQTNSNRIKSVKIGLITTRLNLTPEQSKNFWPIYETFNLERNNIRHDYKRLRQLFASKTTSDETIKNSLKEMIALKQKEVDLEKAYMNKFLKVISARQLASLYKAEQDFNGMLLKELGERRHPKKDQK